MKYRFSINGEYVSRKSFENAYGKCEVQNIIKELNESGKWTTIFLNDGLDELSCYSKINS